MDRCAKSKWSASDTACRVRIGERVAHERGRVPRNTRGRAGFALLKGQFLYVESWIRVVGGSGQAHVITHEGGVTLIDEGFV